MLSISFHAQITVQFNIRLKPEFATKLSKEFVILKTKEEVPQIFMEYNGINRDGMDFFLEKIM